MSSAIRDDLAWARRPHPRLPSSGDGRPTIGDGPKTAVPLDPGRTELLWNFVHDNLPLYMALKQTQDLLFGTPFQVAMGPQSAREPKREGKRRKGSATASATKGGARSGEDDLNAILRSRLPLRDDVRTEVVERYWMPWLREVDHWLRLFGVAPWFLHPVDDPVPVAPHAEAAAGGGGEALLVPAVPTFGTGHIETYVRNGAQAFQWRWNAHAHFRRGSRRRANAIDPDVRFITQGSGSQPDAFGRYRSELNVAMDEHLSLKEGERLLARANQLALSPPRFVEFAPDAAKASARQEEEPGSDAPLRGLEQTLYPSQMGYGAERGDAQTNLEYLAGARQQQVRGQYTALSAEGDFLPPESLVDQQSARARYLPRETPQQRVQYERALYLQNHPEARHLFSAQTEDELPRTGGSALPPNTVHLQPYERVVTGSVGQPNISTLVPRQNRYDKLVTALVGFPLELIMSMSGSGGSGFGGGGGGGGASAAAGGAGTSAGSGGGRGSGMYQHAIMHQRDRSAFYARKVREIFSLAYAPLFARSRLARLQRLRARLGRTLREDETALLLESYDVEVFFPRTPLLSFDELRSYFMHGLISADDFAHHTLDMAGMGDRKPEDGYERRLKRQRDQLMEPKAGQAQQPAQQSTQQKPQSSNQTAADSRRAEDSSQSKPRRKKRGRAPAKGKSREGDT